MKIKKTTLYFSGLILIIALAAFFFLSSGSNARNTVENPVQIQGETQKVVLGMKDYNYYPETIRVKANQPVELSLDDSVYGCLRSFTIKDLGVAKYMRTSDDSVTFTPTKKGTYSFACSMGMAYGKIIVE